MIEQPLVTETDTCLPAMTGAELKATREFLGLSTAWIADQLVIGERRLQRMESGKESIPNVVITLVDESYREARKLVDEMVAVYRRRVKAADGAPVWLETYRTDQSAGSAGARYPSRWYRHVAARVADGCPGAIITYPSESESKSA